MNFQFASSRNPLQNSCKRMRNNWILHCFIICQAGQRAITQNHSKIPWVVALCFTFFRHQLSNLWFTVQWCCSMEQGHTEHFILTVDSEQPSFLYCTNSSYFSLWNTYDVYNISVFFPNFSIYCKNIFLITNWFHCIFNEGIKT